MESQTKAELESFSTTTDVRNPGSALGEAIGHLMEAALSEYITPLVLEHSCKLLTTGPMNEKTGKYTDLKLKDSHDIAYSIDGVIVNQELQPIILIESKYIRYTKHNRDKASWICQAHGSLRDKYSSVRNCLAILAGSWSSPSLEMLRAYNISYFRVPFQHVVDVLKDYDIKFDWDEKEREVAKEAHHKFIALSPEKHLEIGVKIIEPVLEDIKNLVDRVLDDNTPREIAQVIVEIRTTLGEVKRFSFKNREDALNFLEDFTFSEIMHDSRSFTIFDQ